MATGLFLIKQPLTHHDLAAATTQQASSSANPANESASMVHPLVITAAATAGIGAAVAFEVAVFRPWRDENWPQGFGHGVRNEFLKLRREVEQAVNEIQDDFRTLRDGRRRHSRSRQHHRRLSDDELEDFRRGVGEEASRESVQHEFEMHERQASAYRDRLRASMSESFASGSEPQGRGLRQRRPVNTRNNDEERQRSGTSKTVPVVDVRRPSSPELPHHRLGDASPSVGDATSLPADSRFNSVRSLSGISESPDSPQTKASKANNYSIAADTDLLGLDFGQQQEPSSSTSDSHVVKEQHREPTAAGDPFANIVDGTASSWHAVFSDRESISLNNDTDEGHVIFDTNGLSQTLSDQHQSFHDLHQDIHSANASVAPDSPYRSNRALHSPPQTAPSTGTRSGRTESEPDFEVLSDTAESEGRWSHLHAPPSPTISSGSDVVAARGLEVFSVMSDGEDSWAELSEAGSDVEGGRVVRG